MGSEMCIRDRFCTGTDSLGLSLLTANNSGSIPGANSTSDGAGNTTALVQFFTSSPAGEFCNALALNGFTDWYLPAPDELQALFDNRIAIGGFASTSYYSSRHSSGNTFFQNFTDGSTEISNSESVARNIRCVRRQTDTVGSAFINISPGVIDLSLIHI